MRLQESTDDPSTLPVRCGWRHIEFDLKKVSCVLSGVSATVLAGFVKGEIMGGFIFGVGFLGGSVVWLYTTYVFFATGQTVLALISLIVPPAGLVLPFLISVPWGVAGVASLAVMITGAALSRD